MVALGPLDIFVLHLPQVGMSNSFSAHCHNLAGPFRHTSPAGDPVFPSSRAFEAFDVLEALTLAASDVVESSESIPGSSQ